MTRKYCNFIENHVEVMIIDGPTQQTKENSTERWVRVATEFERMGTLHSAAIKIAENTSQTIHITV
jgi:hypothetical protein